MSVTHVLLVSLLFAIACSILSMCRIPKPHRGVFKVLLLLSTAAFLVESFGFYSASNKLPNILVYNLYIVLELVLIHLVLYRLDAVLKWLLLGSVSLGFLSLTVQFYSGMNPQKELFLWSSLFIGLAVVAFALVIFIRQALNANIQLQRTPTFWILMGLLIYFGGYIPVLSGESYLAIIDEAHFDNVYLIMTLLAILRYLFLAIAAFIRYKSVQVESLERA